jgi:hypothetical protein
MKFGRGSVLEGIRAKGKEVAGGHSVPYFIVSSESRTRKKARRKGRKEKRKISSLAGGSKGRVEQGYRDAGAKDQRGSGQLLPHPP